MREIKFRCWDGTNKKFTYWAWDNEGFNLAFCLDPQIGVKVSQYTGLKDRNGKEVYEGDLINWGGLKPLQIAWKDPGFAAQGFGSKDILVLNQEGMGYLGEVIGNIYENNDLLK